MEFANVFNKRFVLDTPGNAGGVFILEPYKLISSGEQIMMDLKFTQFELYSVFQDLFGGDFVFKGFPAKNRSGNSVSPYSGLAISSLSENKEGAWEFIRMILSEEWQGNNNDDNIPTRKSAFDKKLSNAMEIKNNTYGWADFSTETRPLTQEHVDNIRALVNSASSVISSGMSSLEDIIWSSLMDYFSGAISVQDAVRVMQSRAVVFVAERR